MGRQEAAQEDAQLIQQHERDGQHELRQHVRRGEHGRHDEGPHQHVAAGLTQVIDRHHAQLDHQHFDHRHLEGQAEAEEDGQGEVPVPLQVLHHVGARLLGKREEELVGNRQHEAVGKADAHQQEDHRQDDQRADEAAFMRVKPGRDEGPGLIQHPRQRQQHGRQQRHLGEGEEGALTCNEDRMRARRQRMLQRLGQELHQLGSDIEAGPEQDEDDQQRADDAVAQLGEVGDEVFFFGRRLRLLLAKPGHQRSTRKRGRLKPRSSSRSMRRSFSRWRVRRSSYTLSQSVGGRRSGTGATASSGTLS